MRVLLGRSSGLAALFVDLFGLTNDRKALGLLRTDNALLREDRSPTAATMGQEHHCRKLPAHTHGSLSARRVRGEHAPIRAGFGFRARNTRAVNADPDRYFSFCWQSVCPYLPPGLALDPAIGERLVDTGPFPAKGRRRRQFRQRARGWLTAKGIGQLEERIRTPGETLPESMPQLCYGVKVHLSNAPFDTFSLEATLLFWQSPLQRIALLVSDSLNINLTKGWSFA